MALIFLLKRMIKFFLLIKFYVKNTFRDSNADELYYTIICIFQSLDINKLLMSFIIMSMAV